LVAQFVAHEMNPAFVTTLQGDRQAITDKEKKSKATTKTASEKRRSSAR